MPIIIVYGVGKVAATQERMSAFALGLRQATASIKELGLKPDQVTCFFPSDIFLPHRGSEIVIFVEGLFKKPKRTVKVRTQLANKLVGVVNEYLYKIDFVECFVRPFDPKSGFATSEAALTETKMSGCPMDNHACDGEECSQCLGEPASTVTNV
jgi:hypothetical protein